MGIRDLFRAPLDPYLHSLSPDHPMIHLSPYFTSVLCQRLSEVCSERVCTIFLVASFIPKAIFHVSTIFIIGIEIIAGYSL